jgi:hypothetical protein
VTRPLRAPGCGVRAVRGGAGSPRHQRPAPAATTPGSTWPPAYLHVDARLAGPRYVFEAHPVDAHPQHAGGMTYGETVITLPYVRERRSHWFDLLHTDLLIGDLHPVVLTLRRV